MKTTWTAIFTLTAKKLLTAGVIAGAILASLPAFSGPVPAFGDAPKEGGRILILNSYHPGYLFSDNEQTGILETLRVKFPDASIHIEYLDTKNFPKPEHYKHLAETLAYKHGKDRFSVILALDNPALDFLTKFGKPLFGDTPVVFCGINNFSSELLGGLTNVTGVVERMDIRSTIEIMLRLHPAVREIYALVDDTLTGGEIRQYTESLLSGLSRQIKVTFTKNPAIEEVVDQTQHLGSGSLVLILTFSRDRNGKVFDPQDLIRLVCAPSPVPVYVVLEERMGTGVMGGFLLGGKYHGSQAAQMAMRILGGEPAASISILTEPPAQPIFDFIQLKRFGIKESALPPGSIILNKPPGLYASHKGTVWMTLGFIFLLFCVIAALLINIRMRRQAEEGLGQNRAMLREVLDMTPQTIFWKDREGIYLGCNAAFAKSLGLSDPEQIVGKTDFDLPWPREEAEAYRADDQDVVQSNQAKRHIIEPLQQIDGTRIWIDTTKVPLRDKAGQVYGVLGVSEDVTEKRKAEEQLYLAQFTIDNAPDIIFLIDENAHFRFVNESACRRLGYSKEELLALRVFDLNPSLAPERWSAHWRELKERGSITLEVTEHTKGGEVFPVEIIANRVLYKDTMYNCSFLRDITDRKMAEEEREKLEAQLRQAQKMEAIGTLAGGIAHDFNNILSVIFGNVELARMEDDDPLKRRKQLDQVLLGADRAKELVQQILAFSRKTTRQKQSVQVSLILKETLKMLRSTLPTTIEIRQKINPDGVIMADPTQIHQVIMNLCTNSYHAMRETGGILALSLDEVMLEEGEYVQSDIPRGRYLKLDVSDTGCGMDERVKEKIFEPYFTTKKHGEGTGMGLAVVHGIIKSHNGHIAVYSEPAKGTSIHVYLPLTEEEAVSLPPASDIENVRGHGERILFIDDEVQICDYMSKLLQGYGYQVTVFSNSVQAWEEFRRQPDRFDLIVTDMTMPRMSGSELAGKALEVRPGLPVILCTGHSGLINKAKAVEMGIYDYLEKPVAKDTLMVAIRKALGMN